MRTDASDTLLAVSRDNWIQTLYITMDIGAERPIHKCGRPMAKVNVRNGRQQWGCRHECNEAVRRYRNTTKGRETDRKYRSKYMKTPKGQATRRAANSRRIRVGEMYLGRLGFTQKETEELLNGKAN